MHTACQPQLRPDNEPDIAFLRGDMRTDDSCHRTFVGQCDSAVTEFSSSLYQFARVRCAAQKREITECVKFRIARKHRPHHAKNPWRNHDPVRSSL